MNTFIIYTKSADNSFRTIKVKATEYYLEKETHSVVFQDNGKGVAIFNLNEIVGFIESGHMVN